MKLNLDTSIARILSVGMYETLLDTRCLFDSQENEILESEYLTQEEKDYFANALSWKFDDKKYTELVKECAIECLEEYFDSIKDIIKVKLTGDSKIVSPREYNFYTDELHFSIEIDPEEINKIFDSVINDKAFWKWAEQYKSCDGFISFMPWQKQDYIDALQGQDITRAVAMYLTYIYEKENNFEKVEFDYTYSIFEKISENHFLSEFINDEKAQEIMNRVYCPENV